jgi:glycosyltransferase involved in cell wall biosynthesis
VELMKIAVRSVLAQSDPRWRLTVVDDGTAAGVPEWFAELAHPQVRYLRNPHNLGVSGNFQRCLDLAEQDYLVMMGCDDVMLPNYVATVLGLLERYPDATIVQPGVEVIGSDGAPIRSLVDSTKQRLYAPKVRGSAVLQGEDLAVSLLRGNWLYFPSLCWRSRDIKAVGFDTSQTIIMDLGVVLTLVEQGGLLVVSDELCFQYRRHAVSASSAGAVNGSRFSEARDFFLDVAARMDSRGWPRAAKAARWHLSSRLHAATMLPTAARQRDVAGLKALTGHVLGAGGS